MTGRLVGDIIDRCLSTWLLGTYSSQFNALSVPLAVTDTQVGCTLPIGEIGQGSLCAIDDELVYVAERDTTNNRLIVVRGVRGTAAAAHLAGAPIEVNPRFPRYAIRNMMIEEIDSWHNQLYQPKTFTANLLSCAGTITGPGLVDNCVVNGVIRLRRGSLYILDDRHRRTDGYEVQGDFEGAGGTIVLNRAISLTTSFDVTVACGFDTDQIADFGDDCDLIGDVGLTPGMCEITELGAAYRMLVGRGSVRLFPEAEGQSRLAAEVGARDIPAFAQSLLALQSAGIADEVMRLAKRYGWGGA
jgi:hypothetical protein